MYRCKLCGMDESISEESFEDLDGEISCPNCEKFKRRGIIVEVPELKPKRKNISILVNY